MAVSTPIRVLAAALALSTLSFAAGVAGDLSVVAERTSGARVVLRIPPELPADTPRAAPLPMLTPVSLSTSHRPPARRLAFATATAAAAEIEEIVVPRAVIKAHDELTHSMPKAEPARPAQKPQRRLRA